MREKLYQYCLLAIMLAASLAQAAAGGPKAATTDKEAVLWRKLETEIRDIDAHLDAVMGVAIRDLKTGHTFFLNPDEVLPQASSIKIAVLAELYRQHQVGKLKLEDPYTVNAADLVADS